jgi:hypothetical protein
VSGKKSIAQLILDLVKLNEILLIEIIKTMGTEFEQ